MTVTERFWPKVDCGAPDDCWPWLAAGADRYGRFWMDGKMRQASHVAYELGVGPIPNGMDVLHHCDNPPCCNPAHLFLGTQEDNARDMVTKGRSARGTAHGLAKLTPSAVAEIRRVYTGRRGELGELGRRFGVTAQAVRYALKGATWRSVDGA